MTCVLHSTSPPNYQQIEREGTDTGPRARFRSTFGVVGSLLRGLFFSFLGGQSSYILVRDTPCTYCSKYIIEGISYEHGFFSFFLSVFLTYHTFFVCTLISLCVWFL